MQKDPRQRSLIFESDRTEGLTPRQRQQLVATVAALIRSATSQPAKDESDEDR